MKLTTKIGLYAVLALVGAFSFYRSLVAQLSPEDRAVHDVFSAPLSFQTDYTSDNRFLQRRFRSGLLRAQVEGDLEVLRASHKGSARLSEDEHGINFEILLPPLAGGGQMSLTAQFNFDASGHLSSVKWVRRDLYAQLQS